jgi:CheY-like chemotaxis protein
VHWYGPCRSRGSGHRRAPGGDLTAGVETILVIDDVEEHRDLLLQVLEDGGYAVASAGDGEEALEVLSRIPVPTLILLDYRMPGMDGGEFLRRLRAFPDPERSRVPVALMTGLPAHERERAGLPDVDAVLEKPFGLAELRRVVVRFAGPGSHRAARPLDQPPA